MSTLHCVECFTAQAPHRAGWMCTNCGAILPSTTADARATAVANNAARQLRCDDVADVPDALREVLKDVADLPTHIRVLTSLREDALAENRRLRELMAALLEFQNTNGHCHGRDGIWDADNGPGKAHHPCAKCHAFADAREAVGRPRWPSPPSVRGDGTTTHRDNCGCGNHRYGV